MRFSTYRDMECSQLFKEHGIVHVKDLTIENISHIFSSHIEYINGPSKFIGDEHFAIIYLDKSKTYFEQRYDFFHELSHVLKHTGDQRFLPESFVKLQEEQANWYTLYFSMPRHIFEPEVMKNQSINYLVERFEIPAKFVRRRFEIIQNERSRQEFQYKMQRAEINRRKKSLQSNGDLYDSTKQILHQLSKQVGEEKLSYEIKRLL
ncbi:ImmA/IrrE family metallo-endopeptidase [Alkalihalobacillus sp. 1P02AB]|uniref:ImmA/IrrE family metallo-endopeptidase n=1 Tax=Alkalihalobacillus sp. 1P02AB TaxID=3132260 RepID=UPI0039A4717C